MAVRRRSEVTSPLDLLSGLVGLSAVAGLKIDMTPGILHFSLYQRGVVSQASSLISVDSFGLSLFQTR